MLSELEAIKNYRLISPRLATGGQPSAEQIEVIARAGFRTLINLALPTSDGALIDEARVANRHGLEYLHFPIDFDAPELNTALEFLRALRGRKSQSVFVHCVMNYRVSALVYAHRVAVQREAVSEARRALRAIWEPSEVWKRLVADAARLSLPPIRLESERLILREVEVDDVDAIQRYASDPEVCRFMIWGPNSVEQTRAFCAAQLDVQRAKDRREFELAVVDKATKELIGGVGLRVQNTLQREGDIGYVLRRDRWGQGLTAEAVRATLEFGFGVLGLHRVYAVADARNVQSTRVMEKAGMRREGLSLRNLFLKDAFRDTVLFALLEDEFFRDDT